MVRVISNYCQTRVTERTPLSPKNRLNIRDLVFNSYNGLEVFHNSREIGLALVLGDNHPKVYFCGDTKDGRKKSFGFKLIQGDRKTIKEEDYLKALAEIIKTLVEVTTESARIVVNICTTNWDHPDFKNGESYGEKIDHFIQLVEKAISAHGTALKSNIEIYNGYDECINQPRLHNEHGRLIKLYFNDRLGFTVPSVRDSKTSPEESFLLLQLSPRFNAVAVESSGSFQNTYIGEMKSEALLALSEDIEENQLLPLLGWGERFEEFFRIDSGHHISTITKETGLLRFLQQTLDHIASDIEEDTFYKALNEELGLDLFKEDFVELASELKEGVNESTIAVLIERRPAANRSRLLRALVMNYMNRAARILRKTLNGRNGNPDLENLNKIVVDGNFEVAGLYTKIFRHPGYSFARKAFLEGLNETRAAKAYTEDDIYINSSEFHGADIDLSVKLGLVKKGHLG